MPIDCHSGRCCFIRPPLWKQKRRSPLYRSVLHSQQSGSYSRSESSTSLNVKPSWSQLAAT
jgi:hypothetical protein